MLAIDNNNFKEIVLQEQEKLVMVEFWAPWCTYCRRISSAFDAIAEEYGDQLVIGKINIDEAMDIAVRYQVLLIPTIIIFKNGEPIARIVNPPSKSAIEALITNNTTNKQELDPTIYDTIIIGGGPGGYTTALYTTRAGLNTLVLEKVSAGGQMAQTTMIDNYPGFEEGVDGFELGQKMQKCAERFGAQTKLVEVTATELSGPTKIITTTKGIFQARTVVIATGAGPRPLGHAKEEQFLAKGIHYCAACDGMQYKGKTVAVIGGGNTAVADALVLSRICEKVYLVHRRDTLRATKIYHDKIMNTPNIIPVWNSAVSDLIGEDKLSAVEVENLKTGEKSVLDAEGCFVSVGRIPATDLFYGQLDWDEAHYIKADETTITNLPGVYAVGDVRTKEFRQVATAVGDGANAAHYIEEYLATGN